MSKQNILIFSIFIAVLILIGVYMAVDAGKIYKGDSSKAGSAEVREVQGCEFGGKSTDNGC